MDPGKTRCRVRQTDGPLLFAGERLLRGAHRMPVERIIPQHGRPSRLTLPRRESRPHRLLLAVQPRMFQDVFQEVLSSEPDFRIVGAVQGKLELMRALQTAHPDVLLQTWTEDRPPEVVEFVRSRFPEVRIVGITADGGCWRYHAGLTMEYYPQVAIPRLFATIRDAFPEEAR